MDSFSININNNNFIFYSNIKTVNFVEKFQFLINYFKLNFNEQFQGLNVINLPFDEFPVTHSKAKVILTYALSSEQFVFQLSHELIHFYLSNKIKFPKHLKWIEELLCSAFSFYINPDNNYREFLASYYRKKHLIRDVKTFKQFILENQNHLQQNPSYVYSTEMSPAFFVKSLNIIEILKDLVSVSQYLPQNYGLNELNNFLRKFSHFQSTQNFATVLSI